MMQIAAVLILALADAQDRSSDPRDTRGSLVDRAMKALSVEHADLDSTMLAKPGHLAVSSSVSGRPVASRVPASRMHAWGSMLSNIASKAVTIRAPATREKRMQESARVEERIESVVSKEELEKALTAAGDDLVVLEVESENVCQTGLPEEEEASLRAYDFNIKGQTKEKEFEPCVKLKHVFARCARDCEDVHFLNLMLDGSSEAEDMRKQLGVETVPSLLFFKAGKKVWEHKGALQAPEDLGEGVLYFGDTAAGGVKASDHVKQLTSRADLRQFVDDQPQDVLAVVDVSFSDAVGCIRIYPAVLALAKNMAGVASFARLICQEEACDTDAQAVLKEYNIVEVPTFLFFRNGKLVGKYVGSGRGDLIGQVLLIQSQAGMPFPPAPR
eukprot:gnl/TRDRNA2_/TRDRNA2_199215_c0_seq1.p1 gnl/TRDRNA2_/TRDRNA2_199215_c0~~gnl/TRDRNA2_/TRDRNA2_199215_c0_seq1.p1  ORF type:complete len:386 (-),score=71.46 gnl/TRDRNA2_/TRDRNA2_199215_c0_seq1:25-1182(-)